MNVKRFKNQKQRVNYFEIENFIEFVRKKFYKVFFA